MQPFLTKFSQMLLCIAMVYVFASATTIERIIINLMTDLLIHMP